MREGERKEDGEEGVGNGGKAQQRSVTQLTSVISREPLPATLLRRVW